MVGTGMPTAADECGDVQHINRQNFEAGDRKRGSR